jgi:hypothetical protein
MSGRRKESTPVTWMNAILEDKAQMRHSVNLWGTPWPARCRVSANEQLGLVGPKTAPQRFYSGAPCWTAS